MINIVLDTNVIVSAILSPKGNENSVFRFSLSEYARIYCSIEILSEYDRVLNYPKFAKYYGQDDINLILQTIRSIAKKLKPSPSSILMADETDRCFYDMAVACGGYLITGNLKHFPSEPFVMNAKTFMEKKHNLEL